MSNEMFRNESKEWGHRIVAVVAGQPWSHRIAATARRGPRRDPRSLHARKESPRRRKEALSRLSVIGDSVRKAEPREAVLFGLAQWAANKDVSR